MLALRLHVHESGHTVQQSSFQILKSVYFQWFSAGNVNFLGRQKSSWWLWEKESWQKKFRLDADMEIKDDAFSYI